MGNIRDDIKNGSFSRVYLIYGDEDFLIHSNKRRLADAVVPPDDNMNRTVFSGKDISEKSIMELSDTLPFMSSRRLIIIEDSGFFKKAPSDAFLAYIGEIPEETVIIFSEKEVDKRGKLYKAVNKTGEVVFCELQDSGTLIKWIAGYFANSEKSIKRDAAGLLLEKTGTDMYMLKNEMDKLISYSGDRKEIDEADVSGVCSVNVRSSIFAMIDDIAEGRQKKALERYYELVLLKESPMKILLLIAREFNMLFLAKEMQGKGKRYKEMAAALHVPEFAAKKYASMASRFSRDKLVTAINDCVETDNNIKKGKISDRIGTELIIVRYSGGKDARTA